MKVLISEKKRINEVVEELPGALEVFKRFGIDACSGGDDTIAEATARLGIDPSRLMWELRREAESTAALEDEVDREF